MQLLLTMISQRGVDWTLRICVRGQLNCFDAYTCDNRLFLIYLRIVLRYSSDNV